MHPSPTLPEKKPLPLLLAFLRNLNLRRPKIYRARRKKGKENRSSTQQPFYHADKGENHIISRRWLTCWLCRLETTEIPQFLHFQALENCFYEGPLANPGKATWSSLSLPAIGPFLDIALRFCIQLDREGGGEEGGALNLFSLFLPSVVRLA